MCDDCDIPSNGKGDSDRIRNHKTYRDGWETIFGKKKKKQTPKKDTKEGSNERQS